jgi:(E)-4-hydroxy-3-methylbut-2-enyl-diphosphate synthase
VIADYSLNPVHETDLEPIGYKYDTASDKWHISDSAADYIYTGDHLVNFPLPGTLQIICHYDTWKKAGDKEKCHPLLSEDEYTHNWFQADCLHFVSFLHISKQTEDLFKKLKSYPSAVIILGGPVADAMHVARCSFIELVKNDIRNPVIFYSERFGNFVDTLLVDFAIDAGGLLLDGFGDGLMLYNNGTIENQKIPGRTYLEVRNNMQFLNDLSFTILQATRTRISKTEYISCPSCGRTLFDLQETTAKIRAATHHLKGVKIAIMGCIVNGPGEMADADFGYVGSGPGKITLYKGKDIIKRNVPSDIAVGELINLLKENEAWVEQVAL